MHILHLINDYNHTKVHKSLVNEFDKIGLQQTIFIPLRKEAFRGRNELEFKNDKSSYLYSTLLSRCHRFFFRSKIRSLRNSIETSGLDINSVDVIHASTLFSDGAVAYQLHKKFGTRYIVTVRNTDLFTFYRYRKDLLILGQKILKNASKIIFISKANKSFFDAISFFKNGLDRSKLIVINNGINDFWLKNIKEYEFEIKHKLTAVFIGRFDDNKNVIQLVRTIKKHNRSRSGVTIELKLIGGGGKSHSRCIKEIENDCNIRYLGEIYNLDDLKEELRSSDFFIMISKKETFGLVYIEALSQGLPIVYTRGQGVDGLFDLAIGQSTPLNDNDILKALRNVCITSFHEINSIDFSCFNWQKISFSYLNIYNEES